MRTLRIQIRHPQGQIEVVNVEGERALVGSGAHCEIRLGIDQARTEHLRLDLGPAGVFATALAFDPPPTLNRVPITQAPIPPDSVLAVGQTQIQVSVVDGQVVQGQAKGEKKGNSLTTMLMVFACAAVGIYVISMDDGADGAATSPPAPKLWPERPTPPACSQAPGPNAAADGRDRLMRAEAHRERRPFFVADGVEAVGMFETASACLRAGDDVLRANYASESASYLRQDLDRQYRLFQLRVERHMVTQEWDAARRDIYQLLQFTKGLPPDDKYRVWLADQKHALDLKVGTGEKR